MTEKEPFNRQPVGTGSTAPITRDLNPPSVGETVQQAKEQVTSTISEVKHQATEKVEELTNQAKTQVVSQIDTQKQRASEALHSVAHAVRQSSQALRDEEQAPIAEYVERAADQIERASTFLRDRDINDIVYEVESFARRQPAVFLGGAFAIGMLAARFLKSSQQRQNVQYNVPAYPRVYGGYVNQPQQYGASRMNQSWTREFNQQPYAGQPAYGQQRGYSPPSQYNQSYNQPYGQQHGYNQPDTFNQQGQTSGYAPTNQRPTGASGYTQPAQERSVGQSASINPTGQQRPSGPQSNFTQSQQRSTTREDDLTRGGSVLGGNEGEER